MISELQFSFLNNSEYLDRNSFTFRGKNINYFINCFETKNLKKIYVQIY